MDEFLHDIVRNFWVLVPLGVIVFILVALYGSGPYSDPPKKGK